MLLSFDARRLVERLPRLAAEQARFVAMKTLVSRPLGVLSSAASDESMGKR
jgi:hypothetical protein